ncbi:MAG TPA: ABC transporter substrate-binding protein [Verrucomicrobiae bacterium]|nr:ABC transporter substrate-binding protein [Verrucomicrobiae bacterium]
MSGKIFVWLLVTFLLTTFSFAQAQQPQKIPRLGYLSYGSVEIDKSLLAALQQGLRELGYLEGKNIVIEQRYAAGQSDKLPELVAAFVRVKADVIVVTGDPAAHAAKKATTAIPIVIVTSPDPVGTGLIASLAHPGGNVTGLSDFHGGVVTKRLELLKDVAPLVSRIAVLLNPANPSNPIQLKDIQAAAPAFRVTLISLEVKGPDDIDPAFTTIVKQRPGALLVLGDRLFATHQSQIIKLAVKNRLPTIYSQSLYVEAGGLMSYGANFTDQYRRAAIYVDKILKGAKPADLPVEQPKKFELVINLKTAKQIGLTIPPNVLARADRVIR